MTSGAQAHMTWIMAHFHPRKACHRSVYPVAFANHGLMLWNQSRLLWVGTQKSQHQGKVREAVLSWNATYEGLLGTNKRFPQPVPLPEMIDFLVDIRDQEGLYD